MTFPDIKAIYETALLADIPHVPSALVAGMTIGSNIIVDDKAMYENMCNVGVTHAVVVSGYNLNLVKNAISFIKSSVGIYIAMTVYVFVCGFSPPVLRAYVQLLLIGFLKNFGISLNMRALLFVTFVILVAIFPSYISSKSTYLSFFATYGVIKMGELSVPTKPDKLKKISTKPIKKPSAIYSFCSKIINYFTEALKETIFAQLYVCPLIIYYFSRMSLISFLANPLLLWSIPLITILGFFDLFCVLFSYLFSNPSLYFPLFRMAFYPLTLYFQKLVEYFATLPFASIEVRCSFSELITYYIFLESLLYSITYIRSHSGFK